ncbi:ScpA family protein [uncultured Methanomethylovorans sp.]|uniref:ScpA family protein n=1 Tax=uncultured Methanomethylovorans sp. TaxID=183759 RepID=UPI002AA94643|nr:ScpA family protein [uncultured Methanomethylovorans sp.]
MTGIIEELETLPVVEPVSESCTLLPGAIDPEFLETLRALGVDENLLEFSDDVMNEPVEILVNLAKNGEIDPWDIDIVSVTDKFLARIEDIEMMDLRISGRTLLYASILLRMKSNWVDMDKPEEDEIFDDGMDFFEVDDYPVPKLPVRRIATRPVTLQELIAELKKAERVEHRKKEKKLLRKLEERVAVTTDEVLGIAHEEDILGRVSRLNHVLNSIFEEHESVVFSELIGEERSENIMTYVSLLFLATEKKIWLQQDELFGELFIHPSNISYDDPSEVMTGNEREGNY